MSDQPSKTSTPTARPTPDLQQALRHDAVQQDARHDLPIGLTLRTATDADAALIADMHCRSWQSAYRGIFPDSYLEQDAAADRLTYWSEKMPRLTAGAGAVTIAEVDGRVAGFLCVAAPDENNSVLVDNLHAMPGFKGRGAGTAMLERARRWALEQGARRLHLLVLENNAAAIGFYEARGWRQVDRFDDNLGGIDVVALAYEKKIAPETTKIGGAAIAATADGQN